MNVNVSYSYENTKSFCRWTYMDRVGRSNVHGIFQINVSKFSTETTNSIWHLKIQIARITLPKSFT